jgi:HEAT repeat protein
MSHDHSSSDDTHTSGAASKMLPLDQAQSFVAQLSNADPTIRAQAIDALVRLGPDAVALLVDAFHSAELWHYASEALAQIGEPAVDSLIQCLGDADRDNFAADTLSKIGTSAVPRLIDALQAYSPVVKSWAALILGWIGDPRAIPPLHKALGDSSERMRNVARESLNLLESNAGIS